MEEIADFVNSATVVLNSSGLSVDEDLADAFYQAQIQNCFARRDAKFCVSTNDGLPIDDGSSKMLGFGTVFQVEQGVEMDADDGILMDIQR